MIRSECDWAVARSGQGGVRWAWAGVGGAVQSSHLHSICTNSAVLAKKNSLVISQTRKLHKQQRVCSINFPIANRTRNAQMLSPQHLITPTAIMKCITFPQNKTRNRYDPVISPALCDSTLYIHWKKITTYYRTNTQHRNVNSIPYSITHTSSLTAAVGVVWQRYPSWLGTFQSNDTRGGGECAVMVLWLEG